MDDFSIKFIRDSSIGLSGGGDTHIHPLAPGDNRVVVTTRLPGGFTDHQTVNLGPRPADLTGFRFLFGKD